MSLLERVYSFHQDILRGAYPNTTTLVEQFEISRATAKRDINYLRDRLLAPLAFEDRVVDEVGGADGGAGIVTGRLDEDLGERPLAQQAAVGDAVQGDAAAHAQMSGMDLGGSLGETGSVSFQFDRVGEIHYSGEAADADGRFVALPPLRLVDTREASGTVLDSGNLIGFRSSMAAI